MSTEPQLPSLKKGGEHIALATTAVVGAIIDYYAPVAGTIFFQSLSNMIRVRFENAQQILIEEMVKGNLDVLDQEAAETFLPMSYRFLEAAREGEGDSVLIRYAKIIRSCVSLGGDGASDFLVSSRAIEGLSDLDLMLLDEFCSRTNKCPEIENALELVEFIFEANKNKFDQDRLGFDTRCEILCGRGLLVRLGNSNNPIRSGQFMASRLALKIDQYCRSMS